MAGHIHNNSLKYIKIFSQPVDPGSDVTDIWS